MESIALVSYVVWERNFDIVKDFENYNFSIKHIDDYISVEFKNTIPCPIYYFIDGNNHFFYSFFEEPLHSLCYNFYDNYEGTFNIIGDRYGDECIQSHKHLNLFCVKNYEHMKLYKDRIEYDIINDFYTIPIRQAGYLIKNWVNKYTKIVNEVLKENNLVVELSAGLDTRSLTYFWKNAEHKENIAIYSKTTGNSDKYELPIVKQIIPYIETTYNCTLPLYTNKSEIPFDKKITIGGKGGDVWAVPARFRNRVFLDGFLSIKSGYKYLFDINPYMDRDLLKIKAEKLMQMKNALQYLLANEFIDKFEYRTFMRHKYEFTDDIKEQSLQLIKDWGFTI